MPKDIAQLETEAEELKSKIKELEAEAEKQRGIAENAEKKFHEWSNEVGEIRKENKVLKEQIEKLSKGPNAGGQEDDDEDPASLEKSLSESEIAVLDEAWSAAPAEIRQQINDNPKVRKEFIKQAKSKSSPSSWRKNPDEKKRSGSEDVLEKVRGLFHSEKERRRFGNTPPDRAVHQPSNVEDRQPFRGPVARSIFPA